MIRQQTPEWFAARKNILSASDFGAALGINPYCSRQKLWRLKTGLEDQHENAHMRRGTEHEADAIFCYEVATGLLVDEAGLVLHPTEPWLGCSSDGTVGSDGLVECKCPTKFRDEPPAYHLAQMQGQMECTNREWVDYVQWVEDEIRVTRIMRDRGWWEGALPGLAEFWGHVTRLEEPPRRRRTVQAP